MNRHDSFVSRRTNLGGVLAVEAASDRRLARHMHDQFGIGLVLSGAQDSLSGRGEVQARKGDLITVNPGEVHDGRPVSGTSRRWRMLYIEPSVFAQIAKALEISVGAEFQHPVLRQPDIARAFHALHSALMTPAASRDDPGIETAMMEVFAPLVGINDAQAAYIPSAIRQVQAAIDDDPSTPRSLTEMSSHGGLDRFRFLRAFKSATGLPPHAYRVQRQLQMARRLIVEGEQVADAAAAAGFADQAHLARHFARAYGIRPGALASEHKGDQGKSMMFTLLR